MATKSRQIRGLETKDHKTKTETPKDRKTGGPGIRETKDRRPKIRILVERAKPNKMYIKEQGRSPQDQETKASELKYQKPGPEAKPRRQEASKNCLHRNEEKERKKKSKKGGQKRVTYTPPANGKLAHLEFRLHD